MKYNFNKKIARRNTNSISIDGFKEHLFSKYEHLELQWPENELINMWVADMEFATAPEIIDALQKRVKHGIFGYTKIVDPAYKASFIAWAKSRYDWIVEKHHIVTSQGVIPALYDLVGYLCKPGQTALTVTPSYAFFKHAADFNNVPLITSKLICDKGQYYIDYSDIEQKIKNENVSLFILCSPHNPAGRVWTDEELKKLGEICLANNVAIISDEIHCDILREGVSFTPLAKLFPESDQIITCMAPSKTFNLAGFMFANVIIPNDTLRALWKKKHFPFEGPLSITAAQAAYSNGQAWLSELTAYLDDNFRLLDNFLKKRLPKAVFHIPQATYLAWVDVSAYFEADEDPSLFFANHAGVLIEGGNMFVNNAEGYIRINVACPRARLKKALDRMAKAIEGKGERG